MNKGGRPTAMTQSVRDYICERLAGGESLSEICRNKDMPSRSTVLLNVVNDRDGFRTDYICAREAAGFSHADTVVDLIKRVGELEIEPHVAKVMIDGLKWAAERMASNYHGAKQNVDHTSSDGSMTPKAGLDASKLSNEALKEILNATKPE